MSTRRADAKPERVRVTIELDPSTVKLLERLTFTGAKTSAAEVIRYLAASAADGVRRPGSWERGWIEQAFGRVASGEEGS